MSWRWDRSAMSGQEFLAAIARLGLTQAGAARFLGITERTANRYAHEITAIPLATALLLRLMIAMKVKAEPPAWAPGGH